MTIGEFIDSVMAASRNREFRLHLFEVFPESREVRLTWGNHQMQYSKAVPFDLIDRCNADLGEVEVELAFKATSKPKPPDNHPR